MTRKTSVGVIGYGFIGRNLVQRIRAHSDDMQLAFVHTRRREQAADVSDESFLAELTAPQVQDTDIIVEAAHPIFSAQHGARFLAHSDYLPLSTSALIDDALRDEMIGIAGASGTRLLLAAGALIGGEEMTKRSDPWNRVRITFRKHPKNIDFSDIDVEADDIQEKTTVFDGTVREIASRFPRNVNTMVTAALLTTGIDACEGSLVADPKLDCAIAEVEAWGSDGSYIRTEKRQPATGVSGTEMVDSAWYSIRRAGGLPTGTFEIV